MKSHYNIIPTNFIIAIKNIKFMQVKVIVLKILLIFIKIIYYQMKHQLELFTVGTILLDACETLR